MNLRCTSTDPASRMFVAGKIYPAREGYGRSIEIRDEYGRARVLVVEDGKARFIVAQHAAGYGSIPGYAYFEVTA